MAYARVSYTGDASTTIFTVPFPYLDTSHVEVRVAGVLKSVTTHYTWLTSSTIQFLSAPVNGATVYFLRNTPKEARLVNYQDAAVLREEDLDLDSDQSFFIAQEVLDAAINTQAVETFVGGTDYTAGTTTTLALGSTEVEEEGLTVLFDAAAQHQTEFSVAAGVITFNSAIPVGVAQVQVTYAMPMALGLQEGSVTTPKIADLNVTTDKLDALSVTEPKLAQAVFNGLTAVTAATGDHVVIADASDSGNKKKTLVSSILSLVASATTAVLGLVRFATNAEAQTGTATDRGVTASNLNSTVLGMNQTWQDFTASRSLTTTWTNGTGRAICVNISVTSTAAAAVRLTLQGALVLHGSSSSAAGNYLTVSAVIPPGHTYAATLSAGTGTIQQWLELRT